MLSGWGNAQPVQHGHLWNIRPTTVIGIFPKYILHFFNMNVAYEARLEIVVCWTTIHLLKFHLYAAIFCEKIGCVHHLEIRLPECLYPALLRFLHTFENDGLKIPLNNLIVDDNCDSFIGILALQLSYSLSIYTSELESHHIIYVYYSSQHFVVRNVKHYILLLYLVSIIHFKYLLLKMPFFKYLNFLKQNINRLPIK